METTNEVGDLAYAFFSAIPAEKWLSGAFHLQSCQDIYGSNGEYVFTALTQQTSCALGHLSNAIALDCSYKTEDEEETLNQQAGKELQKAVDLLEYRESGNMVHTSIPLINDNRNRHYQHGKTAGGARLNIMHAMLDVKAIHLAQFYGELDEMMEIAKAQVKEAMIELGFEDLLNMDARVSETSVTLEKEPVEVGVRVVAGYAEETVKGL